jgi:photosystem II stability/assembly factor-like uncharacterized protein
VRFHYRFQAADLAVEAATLMPDNAEETARMLCIAGSWIKNLDAVKADGIYKTLVRRCRRTDIGSQADAMRWFPVLDASGHPIPYAPQITPALRPPKIESFRMFDRQRGWAQNAPADYPTNEWRYLLRTTNGGLAWNMVLLADLKKQLTACFYDADSAWVASVYEEGTNITVMRTRNGGGRWFHSELSQTSPIQAASLAISDPWTGWLMLIPDHGMSSSPGDLYRSYDGGADWEAVNSTRGWPYEGDNYTPEQFAARHPCLPCGGSVVWRDTTNGWLLGSMESTTPGFLFFTGDGGANWQLQTLPPPPDLHDGRMEPDRLPQFFPSDGQTGIVGAEFHPTDLDSTNVFKVIYITHDGGLSWQPATPVQFGGAWQFINERQGWMWSQEPAYNTPWTAPVKGALLHTEDGGVTWLPVPATPGLAAGLTQRDNIVQLDFVDADCGWVLIREWNGLTTRLRQTTDGGRSWKDLPMKVEP